MTSLVIGGAGYIGSHVVSALERAGESVVVVDDLSTGRPERLGNTPLVSLDVMSASAPTRLTELMSHHGVDNVYHFAARKDVGESMRIPLLYYRDNLGGLANVLEACRRQGIPRFVFSSSAAVYGEVSPEPVRESAETRPVNPYGRTKLAGEWLVRAVGMSTGMATACLRYFNVAGAGSSVLADRGATNLIPLALASIAGNERPVVFGGDYQTPDGSCVRDFIDVRDLADAHIAIATHLRGSDARNVTMNVGTGRGYSVLEVIRIALEITGRPDLTPLILPRRPGDPAAVVAANDLILTETTWRPRRQLDETIGSAWAATRQGRV